MNKIAHSYPKKIECEKTITYYYEYDLHFCHSSHISYAYLKCCTCHSEFEYAHMQMSIEAFSKGKEIHWQTLNYLFNIIFKCTFEDVLKG